jgi:PKD repeat protein
LSGTATDDGLPSGTLTTTWSKVSGPGTVTFGNVSATSTTASFSAAGTYVLQLAASDTALTSTSSVTITVNAAPPAPPTVNAGSNQTITLPSSANLNGTATGSGGSLTTTWSKVSGPGTVTFGNVNATSTTASFSAAGSYVLQLAASNDGGTSTSTVTITVNAAPPAPPTVNAGSNQTITLPSSANLSGTATGSGSLTTTWSKVSGPGTVTFGNVSATSTTASFSAAGTYVLQLAASNGGGTSTSTVTITVNAAPPAPPTVSAGSNQTITLPSSANLSGTATGSGTLTTTWSKVSGPGTVTFGNASATSTTASFSAAGTYGLQLAASNGGGTSTSSVTITVNPAPTTNAKLLFKTGFEGITLGPMSGTAPDSIFQTFSGTDTTTGFSWPLMVGNPNPGSTGLHTIPDSTSSGALASYFSNAIQSVQGHTGSQTNALLMKLDGFPANSCCAQDSFGTDGLGSNVTSQYIRLWVKLPSDLLTQVQTYKDNFYRTMFAFKTYTDYRIEAYIYGDANGVPYWYAHGDDLADGQTGPYQEYWNVSNNTVAVPFNQWFLLEIYFKRSTGNDGRFFWAVNGQTIGDRSGPNYGVNNEKILEIMYQDVYQNWFPAYQWIDDFEIWDSPPCSTLPCGAN